MMTIKEMSKRTGVSARTLRYYDEIGLFHPSGKSESGYRLYDEEALIVLRQILYFRELDLPLCTIKDIMDDPALDKTQILKAQKEMLTAKKQRLERLICSINDALEGANVMDFTVFDREESAELFQGMLDHMPQTLRDTAINEFGSIEEWKEHYLDVVSSEKVQRQYAKVVEWYGGKEAYAETFKHPLSEEIRICYKRRIDRILDKLSAKRTLEVKSFEIRELIGEYGFVMKQLLQIKDEKALMLSQAKLYLTDPLKNVTDQKYGNGLAIFLNKAIADFYA